MDLFTKFKRIFKNSCKHCDYSIDDELKKSKLLEMVYILEKLQEEKWLEEKNKYKDYTIDGDYNFRKMVRGLKKYNLIAYKKFLKYSLLFKKGNFQGNLVSSNETKKIYSYMLSLPVDEMFEKIHGAIYLFYIVDINKKNVLFEEITPSTFWIEACEKELSLYKGIPVSKTNLEKDMFRINLLYSLQGKPVIDKKEESVKIQNNKHDIEKSVKKKK